MGLGDKTAQFLLINELAKKPGSIFLLGIIAHFKRQFAVVDDIAHARRDKALTHIGRFRIDFGVGDTNLDLGLEGDVLIEVCQSCFVKTDEATAFSFGPFAENGEIIRAQYHILRRNGDWFPIFWSQDIIDTHHEHTGFSLGFSRQWQVNSHLVTVEVGVERRADERMKFNGAAFGQNRLKSLDAQTVQRRGTVQHDRVFLDDFFQDIPNGIRRAFDHSLCALDVRCRTVFDKAFHDERFEEFKGHFFRQAALMHLHFRTNDNNASTGVVDTFTQKVLTETALLPFEHIRKAL